MAQNISKCKRLQRELEDAEDRAESIARTFMRASSISRYFFYFYFYLFFKYQSQELNYLFATSS